MSVIFLYNHGQREIHFHFFYYFRDPISGTFINKEKVVVESFNDTVYRGNLHDILISCFYKRLANLKHPEDQTTDSPYDCALQNLDYALQLAGFLVT